MFKGKLFSLTTVTFVLAWVFSGAGCSSEAGDLADPNGKAETVPVDQLPKGENDDACEATAETWRCAYSEQLGSSVSQVCRSCADISPADAEAWEVCQSGAGASRWLNFNLHPMDCLACDGEFSSACRATGTTECSPTSCPTGCCMPDGTCVPGTAIDACGTGGIRCGSCASDGEVCFGGTCRLDVPEDASCDADEACAVGQFCMEGVCQNICLPDCSGKDPGDDNGCGGVCWPAMDGGIEYRPDAGV